MSDEEHIQAAHMTWFNAAGLPTARRTVHFVGDRFWAFERGWLLRDADPRIGGPVELVVYDSDGASDTVEFLRGVDEPKANYALGKTPLGGRLEITAI